MTYAKFPPPRLADLERTIESLLRASGPQDLDAIVRECQTHVLGNVTESAALNALAGMVAVGLVEHDENFDAYDLTYREVA
jgi:hypothetical protein